MDFNNELLSPLITQSICEICYQPNQTLSPFCPTHNFCNSCLTTYLETKILDGQVLSLECPHTSCGRTFNDLDLQILLSEPLFLKYKDFYSKKFYERDIYFRWCPQQNCSGYDRKSNSNKMKCSECEFEFCFFCANKWHEGNKCEGFLEKEFSQWSHKNKTKKCPVCFCVVEKSGGCPDMICGKCGVNWCWNCGKVSQSHDLLACVKINNGFDIYWFLILFFLFIPVTLPYTLFMFCLLSIIYADHLRAENAPYIDHMYKYKYFYLITSFFLSPVIIIFCLTISPLIVGLTFPYQMNCRTGSTLRMFLWLLFSLLLTPLFYALGLLLLSLFLTISPIVSLGFIGYKLSGMLKSSELD